MTENNPYLTFAEDVSPSGKTKVVTVVSNGSQVKLGTIAWFGRWRQYAFFPEAETVWNPGCLDSIQAQIERLMAERRRP